jgi:FKBP-type peptidyl-prolyl cis-trans isomerase FklB
MKHSSLLAVGLACAISTTFAATNTTLTSKQQPGYALGAMMGQQFKSMGVDVNADSVILGFNDAYHGNKMQMTEEQIHQQITALQKQAIEKRQALLKEEGTENAKKGTTYLENYKKQAGVQTLANGIQYRVLQKGNGPTPTATDTVTVNYEGKHVDGSVFDSSYDRGQPATFALNQVIPGWTQTLQKMPTGSTWEVVIPAEQAYGAQGVPQGGIGPNETLVFKINLISTKQEKKA